ncbi:MAG: class I SAM-dependent methyltransferase [Candidatus Nomurabacteria bacterium]|nr:MAG: class I SAM-dependent methyltransferase [Candidatus Nomurabacteria bacterium]
MTKKDLTLEQQIQEDEYSYPYHWCKKSSTSSGRLYFGYLDLAIRQSSLMKESRTLKILDLGCGDARFLKELEDRYQHSLYGIDYSERAISFAKLLLPNVTFSSKNIANEVTCESNYFDVIFMIETLEHIIPDEIPSLLKEVSRMLKPGGEFIVTVPSDALPPGPKHYQHFSAQKLTDTLSPFFDVKEVVGQDKMGFHPLKIYDKLIDNKIWTLKKLSSHYNLSIWPKYFNKCENNKGRRVISVATKPMQ